MSAYNTLMNLTGGLNKSAAGTTRHTFGPDNDTFGLAEEAIGRRAAKRYDEELELLRSLLEADEEQRLLLSEQERQMAIADGDRRNLNYKAMNNIISAYGKYEDADRDTLNALGSAANDINWLSSISPEYAKIFASGFGKNKLNPIDARRLAGQAISNPNDYVPNAQTLSALAKGMADTYEDAVNNETITDLDKQKGLLMFRLFLDEEGGFPQLLSNPDYVDIAPYFAGQKTQVPTRELELGADPDSLDLNGDSGYMPNFDNISNAPEVDATLDVLLLMPEVKDNYTQHEPHLSNPQMPLIPYMPKIEDLSNMQKVNYSGGDLEAAGFKAPDISTWQHLKNMGRDYSGKLLNWLKGKHTNMMGSGVDVPNWALALGALGIGGLGAYGINQYMKSREEEEYEERMRRLIAQQALMKSGAARAMSAVDKTEGPTLPLRPTLNERSSLARLMEITRTRGLQNVDFGQKGMSSVKSAAASVMSAKDPDEKGNMEQRPTLRPESSLQKLLRITQTHTSK